jgi:hypothetical protein
VEQGALCISIPAAVRGDAAARPRYCPYKKAIGMLTRTKRHTVTFAHDFTLKGCDRPLVPGAYEVVTDEELIEGLSFPVYRRVSTFMMLPRQGRAPAEMVTISPDDLSAALERDHALDAGASGADH